MNAVETKNIDFTGYAGVRESFWYLPPRPYAPAINITGLTAVLNVYDGCGGALLLSSGVTPGLVALSTETAVFTEVADDGVETAYSIPNTATLTVTLSPAQVAAWDRAYYELYVTDGSTITPLVKGWMVKDGCATSCC